MQAQIVIVRGRVGPRISKDAIAVLPRAGAPILIRARIVVEGLRSTDQLIDGFHTCAPYVSTADLSSSRALVVSVVPLCGVDSDARKKPPRRADMRRSFPHVDERRRFIAQ